MEKTARTEGTVALGLDVVAEGQILIWPALGDQIRMGPTAPG